MISSAIEIMCDLIRINNGAGEITHDLKRGERNLLHDNVLEGGSRVF